MKKVVISQRVDTYPDRNERRDALDQRMAHWLCMAGYMPFPLPNALVLSGVDVFAWLDALQPNGVLLSGGNDIGVEAERDTTERRLLEYAHKHCLPLLGICRGMQMLGQWAGGGLTPVVGHAGTRHELVGELSGKVNSYHCYSLACCPSGFNLLARSKDGCIEAIRHKELPWEGWMWHPEREQNSSARDIERFKRLFS